MAWYVCSTLSQQFRASRAIVGSIVLKGHMSEYHEAGADVEVEDAAAVATRMVVHEGAILDGQRAIRIPDAAAVAARMVVHEGAILDGQRAVLVEDAAAGQVEDAVDAHLIAGDGTTLEDDRAPTVEDAAAAVARLIAGDDTIPDGERGGREALVDDAAAYAVHLIAGERTVLDGHRGVQVEDAAGVPYCLIAGERTVLDGHRATLIPDAAYAAHLIAGERTVLDGQRGVQVEDAAARTVEDAAAVVAVHPIAGERTVLDGHRATLIPDAAAAGDVIPVLDRHVFDRDRAAGDRKHSTTASPIDDGAFLSRTANHDAPVNRDEFVVDPRRHIDGRARGVIDRHVDHGIGRAGHPAGPCPRLGARHNGRACDQSRQPSYKDEQRHQPPGSRRAIPRAFEVGGT
jgi:hypothetical protein